MPLPANVYVALSEHHVGQVDVNSEPSVVLDSELILEHLNARGFVPFHPALAQSLGHKAALFLGLCLYWTRHGARNNPHRQGWIYLSSHDVTDATTLTRREQETVRELLVTTSLLEQQLTGRPAKMHYRLNLRLLANRLEIIDAATATVETAWAWFEKSVSFYRPLGDLAGSAAGGLYLSFVLRQQRKALLAGHPAEVMRIEPLEVERTLCLSPKVQRAVRERLKRLGVVTLPAGSTSMVRLNIQAILACVRGQDVAPLPSGRASDSTGDPIQAGEGPRISERQAVQRSLALIAEPGLPVQVAQVARATAAASRTVLLRTLMFKDRPIQPSVAEFQQLQPASKSLGGGIFLSAANGPLPLRTRAESAIQGGQLGAQNANLVAPASAQSAKLEVPKTPTYIQTGSTNTTTTTPRAKSIEEDTEQGRRRPTGFVESIQASTGQVELIFPGSLSETVFAGLRDALRLAPPGQRQQLLDELQGQLLIPTKTIHNPVGWMLGLIRRCAGGNAVLALAEQVARDREQRRARQLAAASKAEAASAASSGVPESERQRLRSLRAEFVKKAGRS